MRAIRRRDTRPELEVRRLLHAAGLRYRVDWPLPTNPRRRADIAFPKQKIVVFIDGCFWHGCPDHFTAPKANRSIWEVKIAANVHRDRGTDQELTRAGFVVLRFWEHQSVGGVAAVVVDRVAEARLGGA